MTTQSKYCQICQTPIPDDFVNDLCYSCYDKLEKEKEDKKKIAEEELKAKGLPTTEEINKENAEPHEPVKGEPPPYKENPQQDEIDMVQRNVVQFLKTGQLLWKPTRLMYQFIRDSVIDIVKAHPQYPKFIWKPTMCDVGCGIGCGSNILSQEADFVWGIDKNPQNVKFATESYARYKNNIYYTPEIRFDVIDVEDEPREMQKFDMVVAIEVLEHLADMEKFFAFIKRLCKPETLVWVSTPNRNAPSILDDHPRNKYHVREYKSEEFVELLKKHFGQVDLFNWKGEVVDIINNFTPILALCRNPL